MPKAKKEWWELPAKKLAKVADPVNYKGKAADAVMNLADRLPDLMPTTGSKGRKIIKSGKKPRVLIMSPTVKKERKQLINRLRKLGRDIQMWEEKKVKVMQFVGD